MQQTHDLLCIPSPQHIYKLNSFTIAGILSVVLNTLVLLTIALRKHKVYGPEIYLVNLALCDLAHSLLGNPLMIASAFMHRWPTPLMGEYSQSIPLYWLMLNVLHRNMNCIIINCNILIK